jgi:hypothetical protein
MGDRRERAPDLRIRIEKRLFQGRSAVSGEYPPCELDMAAVYRSVSARFTIGVHPDQTYNDLVEHPRAQVEVRMTCSVV